MNKKNSGHIVILSHLNMLKCTNCGDCMKIPYGKLLMVIEMHKTFKKHHQNCKKPNQ